MNIKSVIGIPGFVYSIPLFFTEVSPIHRFSKKDFPAGENRYAYCRVIADQGGAGILIEVFNFIGADTSEDVILSSGRIFDPLIIIGDGIKRGRWRKVFESFDYDPERDSGKSDIEAELSKNIDNNIPVKMWSSLQLERHIVECMPARVKDSLGVYLEPLDGF